MQTSIHHQLIRLGENCDRIAAILQRKKDHRMHRVYVGCRELSLCMVQALSALSAESKSQIKITEAA